MKKLIGNCTSRSTSSPLKEISLPGCFPRGMTHQHNWNCLQMKNFSINIRRKIKHILDLTLKYPKAGFNFIFGHVQSVLYAIPQKCKASFTNEETESSKGCYNLFTVSLSLFQRTLLSVCVFLGSGFLPSLKNE